MKQITALIVAFCAVGSLSAMVGQSQPGRDLSVGAFEKLKGLTGTWEGRSTKGWQEQIAYSTIAGGSVVTEHSLDAHPGEQMMTMFHMDGDRLMLTHYCVAKNQPRLLATSISEDTTTIVFTFLDATNLASRNKGHMDKLIMKFLNDSTISTQWTWYQDGNAKWLEEIICKRMR